MGVGRKVEPGKPGRKKLPGAVRLALANRLREELKKAGMSTTDVARRLRLAGSANVARWVAKNPAAPDLASFVGLCEAFGFNANYLLFGEGPAFRDRSAKADTVELSDGELDARVREKVVAALRARTNYQEEFVRGYLSRNDGPIRTLVMLYAKLMKFDVVGQHLEDMTSQERADFRRLMLLGIVKGVRDGEPFVDQYVGGECQTKQGRPRPARPKKGDFGLGLAAKQLREKARAAEEQAADRSQPPRSRKRRPRPPRR